jgi:hypothetical protein
MSKSNLQKRLHSLRWAALVVSVLLILALLAAWIRSYWVADALLLQYSPNRELCLVSNWGAIYINRHEADGGYVGNWNMHSDVLQAEPWEQMRAGVDTWRWRGFVVFDTHVTPVMSRHIAIAYWVFVVPPLLLLLLMLTRGRRRNGRTAFSVVSGNDKPASINQ